MKDVVSSEVRRSSGTKVEIPTLAAKSGAKMEHPRGAERGARRPKPPGAKWRNYIGLVDLEVEDVHDLKVCPIEQNEIATNHDVRVVGRWRREHHLQFPRARLHFLLKPRWQSSTNY
jgi:hypothetical protein